MTYELVKLTHILSGAVLFGTGAGIAFFMLRADATRDARTVAAVARIVVLADLVFTATAVVVQPVSGLMLIAIQGYSLTEPWLLAAYGLYVLTGLCWLPVVAIQLRLKSLAEQAAAVDEALPAAVDEALPAAYDRLYRWWFILGLPAFAAVLGIYWLMVAKPDF